MVSSDSSKILAIAKMYKADLACKRPSYLATSNASTIDVLKYTVNELKKKGENYDYLVLLHATAPLRTISDIQSCIKNLVNSKNGRNIFSVSESDRNPYFNMVEKKNNKIQLVKKSSYVARQQAPIVYSMNASIYVWPVKNLMKDNDVIHNESLVYVMPKERSLDIDDAFDFKLVKLLMEKA